METPQNLTALGAENREELHGATTSTLETSNPASTCNNMNDFKMFEFNSADEVRQAMKAMLSGSKPQNSGDEIKPQTVKADAIVKSPARSRVNSNHELKKITGHVFKIVTAKEEGAFSSNIRKKRPGRPPNAGPSKKIKRTSVTNMFKGRLTNVVPFKHCASESESDDYFY
ncbi:uncharacterized protein LOC132902568 [Amyelois transitella]|uniref:uncharacterized protein LOC132902568 n=1 Tax=Amyelois transitella TaxID=680683 RepID=UPI0029901EE5|nr:uncharacterized protein LOC132902568 [Amyelois transitella]